MTDPSTLIERLRAIDEEAMYAAPASTFATCQSAADLIEQQAAQLAEMPLNENGWHLPSVNEGLRIARECNHGWLPIETAPKDGTVVQLWGVDEEEWEDAQDEPRNPEYQAWPAYVSVQKSIWWMRGGMMRRIHGATHWRPLPAPPAEPRP